MYREKLNNSNKDQRWSLFLFPFLEEIGGRVAVEKIDQIMKDYDSDYSSCEGLAVLYADLVNEHTGFELLVLKDDDHGKAVFLPNVAP